MTLVLDDAAVQSVFNWKGAVDALRDVYSVTEDADRFPPRGMARGDHGWLRTLSGVPATSEWMGLKIIAASVSSRQAAYLIPLFDQRTAQLEALLDGHSITGYRTAAMTALAADQLASPGVLNVAVIGSGFEARNHVRALAAVRDLSAVRVYSPRAESRAAFTSELADLPTTITAAATVEEAVGDATVVLCAARSRDETPTFRGALLRPGMTVLSIGSTLPEQREVATDVIARAALLVADVPDEVLDGSGDLLAARREGIDARSKTVAMADLVSGRHPGRQTKDQIVLYKSVGSAVQDLAVAEMCARSAKDQGVGAELPLPIRPVRK